MDITVVGRNAEIHPNFREYVEDKVSKVTLFYPRAQRIDVELTHEPNPRQAETSERIELTVFGKGPIIRAEASSSDRYAAVDIASAKLFERLRRARDRAKDHRRRYNKPITKELGGILDDFELETDKDKKEEVQQQPPNDKLRPASDLKLGEERSEQLGDSPVIVRQKLHEAEPMSVDQALYQMELVGHPWFLFIDEETMQPCVVYHREGWTYGVIRLNTKVASK